MVVAIPKDEGKAKLPVPNTPAVTFEAATVPVKAPVEKIFPWTVSVPEFGVDVAIPTPPSLRTTKIGLPFGWSTLNENSLLFVEEATIRNFTFDCVVDVPMAMLLLTSDAMTPPPLPGPWAGPENADTYSA